VHNLTESRRGCHFTMMLRGWHSANNEVRVVQMVTLNESKVNHYCITKRKCAVHGGLQPGNCGFETRRGYGYLCLLNAVRCQVKVSATGQSNTTRCTEVIAQPVMILTCLQ